MKCEYLLLFCLFGLAGCRTNMSSLQFSQPFLSGSPDNQVYLYCKGTLHGNKIVFTGDIEGYIESASGTDKPRMNKENGSVVAAVFFHRYLINRDKDKDVWIVRSLRPADNKDYAEAEFYGREAALSACREKFIDEIKYQLVKNIPNELGVDESFLDAIPDKYIMRDHSISQ